MISITIPNNVTSIEYSAFNGCSGLKYVTLGNGVTSIGSSAFRDCSGLTSITIPNNVTSIEYEAFYGCSGLTSVTIGNGVTSIGKEAFAHCSNLTSIAVDTGNVVYDSRENCNAIIETAINTLIAGCQNSTIPNSVKSIGKEAFAYCSGLTSITIPNSVKSIGKYAFWYSGLTSLIIPNSVTSIGNQAFFSCSSLTFIKSFAKVPPTLGDSYVFLEVSTSTPLYVPCESLADYQADAGWSYFTNIQCLPDEESAIENTHIQSPMANCQKLLRNGQLIILRDGVEYNAMGVRL